MLDRTDIKYFELAVGSNIKKRTDVDISAKCPVCGDSEHKNSARLHLYTKGTVTNVNCFNGGCPVENKTVYAFLRDFFPDLLNSYKRETFSQRISTLSNSKDAENSENVFANIKKQSEKTLDFKEFKLKNTIKPVEELKTINLIPYFSTEKIKEYLLTRALNYDKIKPVFGEFYYSKSNLILPAFNGKEAQELFISNSIIVPLYTPEGKMYGFYSRNIDNKKFFTFVWENVGYKVWNFFNIDNSKPVYIFEGIFDAIASGLDNVIACLGADIPEERLKEINHPVFVLDNDKTGLQKSLKYAKRGFSVYVQPKEYPQKDINEMLKDGIVPKDVILSNIFKGILGTIKIQQLL